MCKYEKELSAYMDGEISSDTSAGIGEHVKECRECSEKLDSLRKLSGLTSSAYPSDSELHTEERMERSKHRIAVALERKPKQQKVWTRRLSLTFPAAAAAAFLLVFLGGVVTLGTGFILSEPDSASPRIVSNSERETPTVEEHASNIEQMTSSKGGEPSREEMEELFRFLSERGASVEIKIELPTPSNFDVYGEPQLIRATDFTAIKESSVN